MPRSTRGITDGSLLLPGGSSLTASNRPKVRCSARYTEPVAPVPSFFRIRYRWASTLPMNGSPGGPAVGSSVLMGAKRSGSLPVAHLLQHRMLRTNVDRHGSQLLQRGFELGPFVAVAAQQILCLVVRTFSLKREDLTRQFAIRRDHR